MHRRRNKLEFIMMNYKLTKKIAYLIYVKFWFVFWILIALKSIGRYTLSMNWNLVLFIFFNCNVSLWPIHHQRKKKDLQAYDTDTPLLPDKYCFKVIEKKKDFSKTNFLLLYRYRLWCFISQIIEIRRGFITQLKF